jgi:uncharacterized protein YuzE
MKITFDKQNDTLHIQLNNRPIARTLYTHDVVNIHYSKEDWPVSIDFLEASTYIDNIAETGRPPRIVYDKLGDVMGIRFNQAKQTLGQLLDGDVLIKRTEDKVLARIELISLSRYVDDIDSILEQYDIEKVKQAEQAERNAQ